MGAAKPSRRKPFPRWLVVLVFTVMSSILILGGLTLLVDLDFYLAMFIAVPLGLIVGLLAGRYYGTAGVVGAIFEAVMSIFAAVASAIGAMFAAFSP